MHEAPNDAAQNTPENDSVSESAVAMQTLSDEARRTLCRLGAQAYSDRDYKMAIEYLQQALDSSSTDWKGLICLGLSYFHEQHLHEAEATFSYVVEKCPDEQLVVRSVQALEKVKTALSGHAGGENATGAPTGADLAEGSFDPERTSAQLPKAEVSDEEREKYIKWGMNCYLGGKLEKAIEYFELGLSGQGENWEARLALAMSYHKLEQDSLAEIVLNNLIEQCTDQKILMRAKQALDNVRMTKIYADAAADSPVTPLASPAKSGEKKKKKTIAFVVPEQPAARVETVRKQHPLAVPALIVLIAGCVYWVAASRLPDVYAGLFTPAATTHVGSISTFGVLDNTKPNSLQIAGPNKAQLTAAVFEKTGATKLVIITPSTFDDLADRRSLAEALLQAGYSVCVFDGRGHGSSSGVCTWQGMGEDGLFIYDYLHGRLGYRGQDMLAYGKGLGSVSAALIASQRPLCAVILENPFNTLSELARHKMPLLSAFPESLCPTPNTDLPARLNLGGDKQHPPMLVLSSHDAIVPAGDTQAFFNRVSGPKEMQTVSGSSSSEISKFIQKQ